MNWFSRKPKPRVIVANYRDLTVDSPPNPDHGYAFTWDLDWPPRVGLWVMVPGGDGRLTSAIVAQVDAPPPPGIDLVAVSRLVYAEEIQRARDHALAAKHSWLNMARRQAGLPTPGRRRAKTPEGFPQIAPADGPATPAQAGQFGRMWWRAYKLAEELGRERDEVTRYSSIAHRWYAIRDRG